MPEAAEKLFRSMLKELRPMFDERGFRASSQNFILESPECWVIVNFQKSRLADREGITFYVNVAASSKRWLGFYGKPAEKVPPFYGCDWQWRVEHFSPDRNIGQWTLEDEASLQQTLAYLRPLFREFVFPAAQTMTTEENLLEHSGGVEYPQLKTRAYIFAATNQLTDLRQAVATLIGKFSSGVVGKGTREHLQLLSSKFPGAMQGIEL